ncbi:MAG: response regulator transcription factor [Burkholderiaceae bacterium]|jgi:DNA-binding NarL/FixJ family response regulator
MAQQRKKILYIEDSHETGVLVAEDLVERGFEVEVAENGTDGLAAILRVHPDLVLCDINMPGMSGFQVLEALSAIAPSFANMPFVFLTALTDRDTELQGRRLGADDYVTKPIDFDLLESIINARLARVARIDVWTHRVDLTQREIEALTWSARGKTSDEIASILGLSKRTVDFHIDNARVKLNVSSRIQAAVKAAAGGLIEP